jgi:hypothetical protein
MQEVGGSIPPGSTSLRWLRQLRPGKPHRSEGCRGEARRAKTGLIGVTDDLRARLAKHNADEVPHTSKYKPSRSRSI